MPNETFELLLVGATDEYGRPMEIRLRAALKTLLRSYGLRCTSVKNLSAKRRVALAKVRHPPDPVIIASRKHN